MLEGHGFIKLCLGKIFSPEVLEKKFMKTNASLFYYSLFEMKKFSCDAETTKMGSIRFLRILKHLVFESGEKNSC